MRVLLHLVQPPPCARAVHGVATFAARERTQLLVDLGVLRAPMEAEAPLAAGNVAADLAGDRFGVVLGARPVGARAQDLAGGLAEDGRLRRRLTLRHEKKAE